MKVPPVIPPPPPPPLIPVIGTVPPVILTKFKVPVKELYDPPVIAKLVP